MLEATVRFYEEQRFSGGWRWFWAAITLGPGAIVMVVFLVATLTTSVDVTLALRTIAVVEFIMGGLLFVVLRSPLIVRVTDDGIHLRVPPFVRTDIPIADVASVEEMTSGLFHRYGAGVGKRYGDRLARYTVGNDAGVVLTRHNGWRIVIGSKRPAELAAAIRDLMSAPHMP